jgi:hypothetical protein
MIARSSSAPPEELLVADRVGALGDRRDVVVLGAESAGDLRRGVLVQEQPHASASPRWRQPASSRSAIA